MLSPIDNSKREQLARVSLECRRVLLPWTAAPSRWRREERPHMAARLLQCAVNLGHSGASNNLGVMHHKGVGVPLDRSLAMQFWAKAAERGEVVAMFNLANAYYNGGNLRNKMGRFDGR